MARGSGIGFLFICTIAISSITAITYRLARPFSLLVQVLVLFDYIMLIASALLSVYVIYVEGHKLGRMLDTIYRCFFFLKVFFKKNFLLLFFVLWGIFFSPISIFSYLFVWTFGEECVCVCVSGVWILPTLFGLAKR